MRCDADGLGKTEAASYFSVFVSLCLCPCLCPELGLFCARHHASDVLPIC
jgi:hypothetical protein